MPKGYYLKKLAEANSKKRRANHMKCRKNVKNLRDDEKRRYVNAFLALKSQDSVIHPGTQFKIR